MSTNYSKEFVLPPELPAILKDLTREILRNQPADIHKFALQYFENKVSKKNLETNEDLAPNTENANEVQEPAYTEIISHTETRTSTNPVEFTNEVIVSQPAASESIDSYTGKEKDVSEITASEFQGEQEEYEKTKDTYHESSNIKCSTEADSPEEAFEFADQGKEENTTDAGEVFEPNHFSVEQQINETTDIAVESKIEQIDTTEEERRTEIEASNFQPTAEKSETGAEFAIAKSELQINIINTEIASSEDLTDAVELHREAIIEAFAHTQSSVYTPSVLIPVAGEGVPPDAHVLPSTSTVTSEELEPDVEIIATSATPQSLVPDRSTEADVHDVTTSEAIEHDISAHSHATEAVEHGISTSVVPELDSTAHTHATEAVENVSISETVKRDATAYTYAIEAVEHATNSGADGHDVAALTYVKETLEHFTASEAKAVENYVPTHSQSAEALEHVTAPDEAENGVSTSEAVVHDVTTSEAVSHDVTTSETVGHDVVAHTYATEETAVHITTSETAEHNVVTSEAAEHVNTVEAVEQYATNSEAAVYDTITSGAAEHHVTAHSHATEPLENVTTEASAEHDATSTVLNDRDLIKTDENVTKESLGQEPDFVFVEPFMNTNQVFHEVSKGTTPAAATEHLVHSSSQQSKELASKDVI